MARKRFEEEFGVMDMEGGTLPLQMPDAESTAEVVFTQAMEYCARKLGLAGPQEAMDRLREGDGCAGKYCGYSIAKQVCAALGDLDENVKAGYLCDYDATPEDLCFQEGSDTSPIHLIVWCERKTSALRSLVNAVDRALTTKYAELLGSDRLAHLLDAQIIDDDDVENRSGYGALITSLYNPPLKVWER